MNKQGTNFAIAGSIMCIFFFIIVNYSTSPHYLWFFYPSFAVLHWPLALYFLTKGRIKPYSAVTSLLLLAFLMVENKINTPQYPWFLYALCPLLLWPIVMYAGKYVKTLWFALFVSLSVIVYYSALNVSLSPQYPWAIYPAYAVIWWPLAVYFTRKRDFLGFSIWAGVLTIIFFTISNAISSKHTIWAVYPIFAVLWWPLSMYYYGYRKKSSLKQ